MKQKTYDCTLRFLGQIHHQLPLEGVTRHELQLLAFMHGGESIVDVKFAGEREVFLPLIEGQTEAKLVRSEMDEFKRLARKYDNLVNPGRGKKAVEECFHTRIDDFEEFVKEVDAREAALAAADAAEAEAAIKAGADAHNAVEKQIEEVARQTGMPPVGARFAQTARQ